MAGPKRTKAEREIDLVEIGLLMAQGYTGRQVAESLNTRRKYQLVEQTITRDMRELVKRWQDAQQWSVEEWVALELNQLIQARYEAWAAWEKSKGSKGGADPRFLEIVGKKSDRIVRLLGLSKPIQIQASWRDEARAAEINPDELLGHAIDRYIELHEGSARPALPGSAEEGAAEDPRGSTATTVEA